MTIETHKAYRKSWSKLSDRQKERALKTLRQFIDKPASPRLRLHQLKGKLYPQYSMSVGGDLRIHFLYMSEETVVLMDVGTHSQLYR